MVPGESEQRGLWVGPPATLLVTLCCHFVFIYCRLAWWLVTWPQWITPIIFTWRLICCKGNICVRCWYSASLSASAAGPTFLTKIFSLICRRKHSNMIYTLSPRRHETVLAHSGWIRQYDCVLCIRIQVPFTFSISHLFCFILVPTVTLPQIIIMCHDVDVSLFTEGAFIVKSHISLVFQNPSTQTRKCFYDILRVCCHIATS